MRPSQVPTNAPAMPSSIVMIQPPGSLPGMSSFAIAPITRPTNNIQMIPCALKSMPQVCSRLLATVNPEMGSEFDYLRRFDVFAATNLLEQVSVRRGVEIENGQPRAADLVPAQRHRRDVDAVIAEHRPDSPDDARTISVFQDEDD